MFSVLCFGAGVNKLTHDGNLIRTLLELGQIERHSAAIRSCLICLISV
jgi:hypothetical protein